MHLYRPGIIFFYTNLRLVYYFKYYYLFIEIKNTPRLAKHANISLIDKALIIFVATLTGHP